MSVSDDMLMAYADGEFDLPECSTERHAVEAAVKADPDLARRVEQHRAMRRRVGTLYAEVLREPIPESLLAAVRSVPTTLASATVTNIGAQRSLKSARAAAALDTARAAWRRRAWGAMAASLVVGAVVGHFTPTLWGLGPISANRSGLIAQSSLHEALDHQLAANQSHTEEVQIGLSFRSKTGEYCRTFTLQEQQPVSGLACHQGAIWRIQALALAEIGIHTGGGLRPAASEVPAAVRAAVEEQITGDPLDAQGELQAQQNNWK
jgi:hypothetical protein